MHVLGISRNNGVQHAANCTGGGSSTGYVTAESTAETTSAAEHTARGRLKPSILRNDLVVARVSGSIAAESIGEDSSRSGEHTLSFSRAAGLMRGRRRPGDSISVGYLAPEGCGVKGGIAHHSAHMYISFVAWRGVGFDGRLRAITIVQR